MKGNYRKIGGILVAMLMVASAIFVFGIVNIGATAGDGMSGSITSGWINQTSGNTTSYANLNGLYINGWVRFGWTSDVDCNGGLNPITYNCTILGTDVGIGWGDQSRTPYGGNLSENSGNESHWDYDTTRLSDGDYWVNITGSTTVAGVVQFVNGTSYHIVVRNTLTGTPGVNKWQGGNFAVARNSGQVLSSTSTNFEVGSTYDINLNANIPWNGKTATYYLYQPIYNGSDSLADSAYNLVWRRVSGQQFDTSTSFASAEFDDVTFDSAGLWVIDDGNVKWSDANFRTIETYNSTVAAWLWVNTSTTYKMNNLPDTFVYNASKSLLSMSITEADGTTVSYTAPKKPVVDIRHDGNGTSINSKNQVCDASWTCEKFYRNNSYDGGYWPGEFGFLSVGNYTAYGYYDADRARDISDFSTVDEYIGVQYYQETNMESSTLGYTHYNTTYGAEADGNQSATWLATATRYNWSTCGPWDPPEYNVTVQPIQVTTATPYTNLPTGNYTMYYGFTGELNITLLKRSGGPAFDASDVKVSVINTAGVNITDFAKGTGVSGTQDVIGADDAAGCIVVYKDKYRDGYIHINMTRWGRNNSADLATTNALGVNGTWKVKIYVDYNGDRIANGEHKAYTEEYNTTVKFKVKKAPSLQFKWIDDDGTVGTELWGYEKSNNDGVIPYVPPVASVPLDVEFYLYDKGGNYFGDTTAGYHSGKCSKIRDCAENITISGDSLFTGKLSSFPGYGLDTAKCGFNGAATGVWSIPIIPTMSSGGGTITIKITAYNTTITKTISIGGANYDQNGTVVTVSPNKFDIDQQDQTLTVTAKYADDGSDMRGTTVYLFYVDDYTSTVVSSRSPCDPMDDEVTNAWVDKIDASGSTCSILFNRTQQTTNQTTVLFSNIRAPRNLTVFVDGAGHRDGYALVEMEPVSDLEVEISHETLMAGYEYDNFYINTTFAGNSTDVPNILAAERDKFVIELIDSNGDDVTGTSESNNLLNNIYDTYLTGHSHVPVTYSLEFDTVWGIEAGTYTVHAYNYTHNSNGYNATLVIKPVEATCDKAPLIWKGEDNNISAIFTMTYDGEPTNGALRIDNMTDAGTFNKTWVYCNFSSVTYGSDTGSTSIEISSDNIVNGVVKVDQITACELGANATQYLTLWFKPLQADGSDGQWAKCKDRIKVEIPSVAPTPQASDGICYIPLGRTTKVYTTVTGRGTTLTDVFVRLHGCGFDRNGTSDVDGRVSFSISPATTGNISIDVGESGKTLVGTVVKVTSWVLDLSIDVTTVEEGGTFTVTAMKEGTTEPAIGADVLFNGETLQTDANGQATFTAPQVTSDRDLTITASKIGYAPEPNTVSIRVINTPGLTITVTSENKDKDDKFVSPVTVTVSNEDTGALITGATVTFTPTEGTATTGTTVNGQVTFTETGTYTITATFGTFDVATYPESVTIVSGAPGFELLTLIAALGVAFILLRRRRK